MYEPLFNTVLVEIADPDAKWTSTDDSMTGKAFSKGKVIRVGAFTPTNDYPLNPDGMDALKELVDRLVGRSVMWNEGHEAGTTFEFDGKQFGLIYWWDLRACKVEP